MCFFPDCSTVFCFLGVGNWISFIYLFILQKLFVYLIIFLSKYRHVPYYDLDVLCFHQHGEKCSFSPWKYCKWKSLWDMSGGLAPLSWSEYQLLLLCVGPQEGFWRTRMPLVILSLLLMPAGLLLSVTRWSSLRFPPYTSCESRSPAPGTMRWNQPPFFMNHKSEYCYLNRKWAIISFKISECLKRTIFMSVIT